jgi:hypothetical protein
VSRIDRSLGGILSGIFCNSADRWQETSMRGANIERMLAQCYLEAEKEKKKKDELVWPYCHRSINRMVLKEPITRNIPMQLT